MRPDRRPFRMLRRRHCEGVDGRSVGKKKRHERERNGAVVPGPGLSRAGHSPSAWASLSSPRSRGWRILVVTLLGGDDVGSRDDPEVTVPAPLGPPPDIGRSAAADALANKTWDDMTADERALVEQEVRPSVRQLHIPGEQRVCRRGRCVSQGRRNACAARTYPEIEAAGGTARATQTLFYCTEEDGEPPGVSIFHVFVAERLLRSRETGQCIPSWSVVMSRHGLVQRRSTSDSVTRTVSAAARSGARLCSPVGDAAGVSERIQYWFDVETARLVGART